MALDYRIDTANRIVTITGDYTDGAGWREMLSAVAADPDYRRGFGFLRDVRASEHPVDAATVIGIIAVVREFWDVLGVRRAAILTRRTVDNPAVMAHAPPMPEWIVVLNAESCCSNSPRPAQP